MSELTGQDVHLGNWRESPANRWSFQHVDTLIRCDEIAAGPGAGSRIGIPSEPSDLARFDDEGWSFEGWLAATHTDSFTVLRDGETVLEHYAGHVDPDRPHILFSVSKSVTGMLAGILEGEGLLDPQRPVTDYLPEVASSGYGTCTVRDVLDMTVALDFDESYEDSTGQYARYREATGWNPPTGNDDTDDLRGFLAGIGASGQPHGEVFRYFSPNSDMLGWLCEAVTGRTCADLLSEKLWQPMAAEQPAWITVDRAGSARTAGGICASLRDLARLGELMRNAGCRGETRVLPADWVTDTLHQGNRAAWQQGDFPELAPDGRYRNQWYQTGNANGAFFAIGIHGQWLYVDPAARVTLAKFSSQPRPLDEATDTLVLNGFQRIIARLQSPA